MKKMKHDGGTKSGGSPRMGSRSNKGLKKAKRSSGNKRTPTRQTY